MWRDFDRARIGRVEASAAGLGSIPHNRDLRDFSPDFFLEVGEFMGCCSKASLPERGRWFWVKTMR
jgi:hypothetical protein